eukprot:267322-Pelagomonas_calceolata.AAC.2
MAITISYGKGYVEVCPGLKAVQPFLPRMQHGTNEQVLRLAICLALISPGMERKGKGWIAVPAYEGSLAAA